MKLRTGSVSITGNFRENNEDRCHVDPQGRFVLVADGMGGQSAGEKASELAIELVSARLAQSIDFDKAAPEAVSKALDAAVAHANTEIMALGEIEPSYHNMGTTITFLLHVDDRLYAGGVGDSRTYLLRDGKLEQLTKDHSLTQALVDAGTISSEEAANHRYRNVLWRYLGTKEGNTSVDPKVIDPQPGDRFLLCSDGVSDGVDADSLATLLTSTDDPQQVAEEIVKAAQAGGSRDNITAVVVFVD
ncbi:MAG: serine/threonine-protein phosphatase [Planctomycetota bacterium]|nr:MAG: serine/threonine-protein phosphatase [Planctomycetota bacterium]REK20765.1 MAG: serine/threonine-protein phosphatase [Planctomycetota bacterium]REK38053.1 MAG: serine/threonine-protein phosphatase [Planctomycetota bacterium]